MCLSRYESISTSDFVLCRYDFIGSLKHALKRGRSDRDPMVVGFTTTCAISAYHHLNCEFQPCSWRGVLDTTLCGKVCQ